MGEKELGMAAIALPQFQPTTALTGDQFESRWEHPATSSAALSKPKVRRYKFSFGKSAFKVVVTEHVVPAGFTENSLPTWVEPTIAAFMTVRSLAENWDLYGGKAVGSDVVVESLSILGQIMDAASPAPSVVPLGDGGLQLEWHRNQQDLEIVFPSDDVPQFYYRDRRAGIEQDGLASDFSNLARLLRGIA
jgi:hypothetical protein